MSITIQKLSIQPNQLNPSPSLSYEVIHFPGGEIGIKLDTSNLAYLHLKSTPVITARLQNSEDVMKLVMIVDALRQWDRGTLIRLKLHYVPYGRQDRVCVAGEAFGLKAFAAIINSLKFESVTVLDPHSDVTGAVLDSVRIIPQATIIGRFDEFMKELIPPIGFPPPVFVSPDAGANKKTAALASLFNHRDFIRADKKRDLATGQILETIVYGDVQGATCVIVDDLIDGGKTFIELAKVLKIGGAARVVLYATHGIFSKGTDVIFESGIDKIYTTNSYRQIEPAANKLAVLDVDTPYLFL